MLGTLIDSDVDCLAFEGALPLCPFPAIVEPKACGKTQPGGACVIRYQVDCCPLRDGWHAI